MSADQQHCKVLPVARSFSWALVAGVFQPPPCLDQVYAVLLLLPAQALIETGTTVISVGHRPTLVSYHNQVLQLGANKGGVPGRWQVMPAQQLMAAAKAQ